jgi:hypothetical protein
MFSVNGKTQANPSNKCMFDKKPKFACHKTKKIEKHNAYLMQIMNMKDKKRKSPLPLG